MKTRNESLLSEIRGSTGLGPAPRRAGAVMILALLLPFAALSSEEQESAPQPGSSPLFYRVTDSEERELWLLGSIHLADSSIYPLPAPVEKAWSESSVVAVEADVVRVDATALQQRMMQAAMDPAGRGLSDRLPPDLYADTARRLGDFGMDLRMLEPMRPWFVAMLISNLAIQRAGLKSEHGVEHHFLGRAGERKVVELEGVERQLEAFTGMSDELEVLFLRHALVDTEDLEEQVRELLEIWRAGDESALAKTRERIREEHPELAPVDELLFTKRNEEMAERIAGYLSSDERHFVIVGAAHLVGEDSIVRLLRRRGLTVERR